MGFFSGSSLRSSAARKPGLAQCGRCKLYKQCISPRMKPTGKGRRKVLVVAEAPGKQEDRQGIQLIGEAGQLLRTIFHELDEELDDCWKTNAIICRPPNNKMDDEYIEACRPNLLKTVRELKPKVIILLGLSPVKGLLRAEWDRDIGTLGRWIGWKIPSHAFKAWVCPSYHPSYIVRMGEDPVLRRLLKDHLRAALKLEDKPFPCPPLKELQKRVDIVLDPVKVRRRLLRMAQAKGPMAFDYETNCLKPENPEARIVSCSFSDGHETWAGMILPRHHRRLSDALRNRETWKVASNIKFEERWTRVKLGHGVKRWGWDTMLAAHLLDNRPGICSLKFQAYVLLGIADEYEAAVAPFLKGNKSDGLNRIEEIAIKDLLLYNGLDSLLEMLVCNEQRRLMGARRWSL